MNLPLLLIWEGDGRLASILRPFAEAHCWQLREEQQEDGVMKWLARGRPGVLVLRLGRDLEREVALLARATWALPDADVVVVAEGDNDRLAGLAWDMGASFVLTPPRARDDLPEIVVGLMQVKRGPTDEAATAGR
jgi:hypothetical protein